MKAWKVDYRVADTWRSDTALVLATTANGAITKLRILKHVGGTRIISVHPVECDVIVK
jgi:hypothetical protein